MQSKPIPRFQIYRPNQTLVISVVYLHPCAAAHLLSLTSGDSVSSPGGGIFHHRQTNIQLVRLRELLIPHDWAHLCQKEKQEKTSTLPQSFREKLFHDLSE
jgi:hypothetical protein